ncbi:hypothetical protein A2U01_0012460 [Trifolium medium]|uniref:Uncharacterized protein n=1 Tax=Trifolium medium TaxID=97028 RepID=A0A392MW52_9FABA|nr:hypothetical protein [Trifolium medium]
MEKDGTRLLKGIEVGSFEETELEVGGSLKEKVLKGDRVVELEEGEYSVMETCPLGGEEIVTGGPREAPCFALGNNIRSVVCKENRVRSFSLPPTWLGGPSTALGPEQAFG